MTDIGVEIQDERGWVVVATPRVVMLVHASEGEPRVASLRAVAEDGSIDDVLQILTEGGILETPWEELAVAYESGFGPSASYYAWEASGRPVHGVRGK